MKRLIFNRTLISLNSHFDEEKEFLDNLPDKHETSNPLMLNIAWEEGYEIFLLDEDKREINIKDLTPKELRPTHNIMNLYLANHFTGFVNYNELLPRIFKEYGKQNAEENFVFGLIESTFGGKYHEEWREDYKDVLNNIKYLNRIIEFCLSELEITHCSMTNGEVDVLDCKAEAEKGLKAHKERIEKIL